MVTIYFLLRYAPFWAIPTMIIAGELTYLFWLRKKKKTMTICAILVTISTVTTCFYYWAGGPEKSVKYLMKFVHFYFN
jgi:hypothetical protein